MSEPGGQDLAPKDRPLDPQENMDMQDVVFEVLRGAFPLHPRIREVFDWEGETLVIPPVRAPKRVYEAGRTVTPDHVEIHLNTTVRNRKPDDPQGQGLRFRRPRFGYTGEKGLLSEHVLFDRTGESLATQNTFRTSREIQKFARSLRGAK